LIIFLNKFCQQNSIEFVSFFRNFEVMPRLNLDQLQNQLDIAIALEAIYLHQGEFLWKSERNLHELQEQMSSGEETGLPKKLCFALRIPVKHENDQCLDCNLCVELPFFGATDDTPSLYVEPSQWMTREIHEDISRLLTQCDNCIWTAIDMLVSYKASIPPKSPMKIDLSEAAPERLIRMWLYLVSLSTKSKRQDMVSWAKDFHLTGIVCAGKPGMLCLEGRMENIDKYLAEIKSKSWADVPSAQKKISVVLVEDICERKFNSMSEITELFAMHGHRNNRPDLSQIRGWFETQGFDESVFLQVYCGTN
jgi:hypothetical protein